MAENDAITHPNDSFVRTWYSKPDSAADLFAEAAPDSLKPIIQPANLRLENTSFIDQLLRSSQSDLLWGCYPDGKFDEEPAVYFYLLLEHQSSVDPLMPLRMLLYISQIWTRWLKKEKSGPAKDGKRRSKPSLPIVFPLVLYQNPKDWQAAQSLGELIDGGLPEDFKPFFPDFRFQLRAVRDYLDEDLPPGFAKLGISVMKLMWNPDFSAWLDQVSEVLHHIRADKLNEIEIEILLVYASTQIEAGQKQKFLKEIQTKLKPMGTEGTSIYDTLIAEGKAEGWVKGKAEGRAEGKAQLLIKQLEAKFPSISENEIDRVLQLDPDRLDELAVSLFSIESLSELNSWFN